MSTRPLQATGRGHVRAMRDAAVLAALVSGRAPTDVGIEFNLTRARVSQIAKRARARLTARDGLVHVERAAEHLVRAAAAIAA